MFKYFLVILGQLMLFASSTMAQTELPSIFKGRWISSDVGYEISNDQINLIIKQYDGSWVKPALNSGNFRLLNKSSGSSDKAFETWGVSSFTSRRDYLTNGTEESVETATFCVFRLEVISPNKLKLSISKPDAVSLPNRHPPEIITEEMQRRWYKRKEYKSITLLRKLLQD